MSCWDHHLIGLPLQVGGVNVKRVHLPERLPAAAALALDGDGRRLLLATPDAKLLVIDGRACKVLLQHSEYCRCRLKTRGLICPSCPLLHGVDRL